MRPRAERYRHLPASNPLRRSVQGLGIDRDQARLPGRGELELQDLALRPALRHQPLGYRAHDDLGVARWEVFEPSEGFVQHRLRLVEATFRGASAVHDVADRFEAGVRVLRTQRAEEDVAIV